MLIDKHQDAKPMTYDYIRGLTAAIGSFTFSTQRKRHIKIPTFSIRVDHHDRAFLEAVRDKLCLKNRVYVYNHQGHDGSKRAARAMLIVREVGQLKNIIVPLFYKTLIGNKALQFEEWLDKIYADPEVPHAYKILPILVKSGHYSKNNQFKN
jgi:hypothetical protein